MLDPHLFVTLAGPWCAKAAFERAARLLHVTPSAVSRSASVCWKTAPVPCWWCGANLAWPLIWARACAATPRPLRCWKSPCAATCPGWEPTPHRARNTVRVAVNADSLATWFVAALQDFCASDDTPVVDVAVDDQDHRRMVAARPGAALGAVTSQAQAIQGCRSRKLGAPAALLRHRRARPCTVRGVGLPTALTPPAWPWLPALQCSTTTTACKRRWVRRAVRK